MKGAVVIFEDGAERFGSLVFTRPVFDLRVGITILREKLARAYSREEIVLLPREYLEDVLREQLSFEGASARVGRAEMPKEGNLLFLNGRILALSGVSLPPVEGAPVAGLKDGELAYLRLEASGASFACELIAAPAAEKESLIARRKLPTEDAKDLVLLRYPWDLIISNPQALRDDFALLAEGKPSRGHLSKGSVIANLDKKLEVSGEEATTRLRAGVNKELRLFVGEGSWVDPDVVFDTTEGPVFIGSNVKLRSFTRVDGPAAICDGSIVETAFIHEGTTLGPVSRIGGEVDASIIQGYSNKHHEGFRGHAFLGEWVNIGAMATNSDLKNNYHNVPVFLNSDEFANKAPTDSGEFKTVGIYVGDHSKIGIMVGLNAGTHIGIGCNIFQGAPMPKYVPSFSWGSGSSLVTHDVERMLDTAKTVMGRRKRTLSDAYARMVKRLFEETAEDRRKAGVKVS